MGLFYLMDEYNLTYLEHGSRFFLEIAVMKIRLSHAATL
jgi:hypothetical protein